MRTPRKASPTAASPDRKSATNDRMNGVGIAIDTSLDPEKQLPPALLVQPTTRGGHKRSVRKEKSSCSKMGHDARGFKVAVKNILHIRNFILSCSLPRPGGFHVHNFA